MHQFERKKKEHNMNAKRSKQVVPFCPISLIPCGFLIFQIFVGSTFLLANSRMMLSLIVCRSMWVGLRRVKTEECEAERQTCV
jgi:hypothetical protein